jgi:hypothetical protein
MNAVGSASAGALAKAQSRSTVRQFLGRGRDVQGFLVLLVPDHDLFIRPAEAAGGVRPIQCLAGEQALGFVQQRRRQRLTPPAVEHANRLVVVEDHALAAGLRRPLAAEHFLGDLARHRGPFELTGRDRLGRQGRNQVALSVLRVVQPGK